LNEGLTGADTLLRVLAHMGVDRISPPPARVVAVWKLSPSQSQSEGVPLYISFAHEKFAVGMAQRLCQVHRQTARRHDPHHRRRAPRHNGPARRASRAKSHGRVHWRVTRFGEEAGPDVAPSGRRSADIGGPRAARRSLPSNGATASMRNRSCHRRSNELVNCDGHAQGTGLRFHPDGISFDKMTRTPRRKMFRFRTMAIRQRLRN